MIWLGVKILLIVIVCGVVVFALQGGARTRAKRRRLREMSPMVHLFSGIEAPELLGIGNVGAVFSVSLAEGWQEQMGITWQAPGPMPERVALKLADFKGNEKKRLATLSRVADALEAHPNTETASRICPFLALGLLRPPHGAQDWLIEVMPLIEGKGLDQVLRQEPERFMIDDGQVAIRELLAILRTVTLLEEMGYYTRNLNAENVIVQPDGRWLRIDYDNLKAVQHFPKKRMVRLARLTRAVLKVLPEREGKSTLITQLEGLAKARGKVRDVPPGTPPSPATLIKRLEELYQNA